MRRHPFRHDRRARVRVVERIGERHVKAEFVEHIRIAPFAQQRALPCAHAARRCAARCFRATAARATRRALAARSRPVREASLRRWLRRAQRDETAEFGGFHTASRSAARSLPMHARSEHVREFDAAAPCETARRACRASRSGAALASRHARRVARFRSAAFGIAPEPFATGAPPRGRRERRVIRAPRADVHGAALIDRAPPSVARGPPRNA